MNIRTLHAPTALSTALAALLMMGCGGTEEGHVRITGHFDHLQQATMFVYADSPNAAKVDTVQVVGGDFEYDYQVQEPTVMTLVYPNFTEMVFLAEPTTSLKYKADVSNLRHASLSGTAANDSLTAFRKRYAAETLSAQQKAAEAYIRKHPADLASVALFTQYFERAEVMRREPHSTLLSLLAKAHSKSAALSALRRRMEPMLHTAIGATPSAGLLKPSALYIFTLSTQYQSGALKRVATEATDSSSVALVEISLDTLDFNAARQKYGVRYVPGSILVGKDGRIADRDIPLERLKAAVDKVKANKK